MKKLYFLFLAIQPQQAQLDTAVTPPTGNKNLKNLNSPGSKYATQYGHATTALIQRITREIIYDATPKQYMDLKILSMTKAKPVRSDEFFYHEMGFGRDPLYADVIGGGGIAAGVTQVIPVMNIEAVTKDTILVYPDDVSRGTVTNVNTATSEITVTAQTGYVLPAIPAGAAGTYIFSNLSPVETDSATAISQYFRMNTVERCNFVQALIKAQRWGNRELEKYRQAGTLSNFIEMNKKKLYDQFRVDMSNIYWNGNMGEVTLANGDKAKTAGGIFPIMQQNGSPNASVTLANAPGALEELALDTEFGVYGATRFLYGTPRAIYYVSKQYKDALTRYTPENKTAIPYLDSIDIGSTKIVFVPVKRFEELSCFPAAWRSRLILLDQASIKPVYFIPEAMGDTLTRVNNGNLNNFVDSWISSDFSIEFNNPLGCGWLDISNLP